ncbi:MAG: histidinol-phosphate transaminase [Chthoniobacterales bacterium]
MKSIWDRANPQLRDLKVYEPGKPIEETARELNVHPNDIIKLASNENPLGPSPKAVAAMRAGLGGAHIYPDGGAFYLRNALGTQLGLALDNIILGNGSNEIIEFLGHAFLRPGDEVVISQYAFIAYRIMATFFGARTIEAPAHNFGHDLGTMLNAIGPKTRLIFIANPNNPTGTLLDQRQIDNFMASLPENIVAVFDEAYFEFLDRPPDMLGYVREGRNIVVLRTFSKIHGLASLRVGYGIAPRELIDVLQKTREPFNVNGLAQIGALAALEDEAHSRETKRIVDAGRNFLQEQFAKMQLSFIPSSGNFVTVNVGDGPALFRKLLAQKIIVRPLQSYGLSEWLRITIGTGEQNEKCIATLKMCLDNNCDYLRHDRRHFDTTG